MSLLIGQSSVALFQPPQIGQAQKRASVGEQSLQAQRTELPKKTPEEFNAIIREQIHSNKTEETDPFHGVDPEKAQHYRKKNEAHEKIERLIKEFKMIKEVWANDPKEMARQLGRIAKQLKEAVKLFSDAAKALGEIGKKGPNISALAAGTPPTSDKTSDDAGSTAGDAEKQVEDVEAAESASAYAENAEQDTEAAEPKSHFLTKHETQTEKRAVRLKDLQDGKSVNDVYGKDDSASRRNAAQNAYGSQSENSDVKWVKAKDSPQYMAYIGNMDFINKAREFAKQLKLEFEHAGKKGVFTLPEPPEKTEEFKEAKKEFEELDEDLIDFEKEVKAAMPIPGTLVSVAA